MKKILIALVGMLALVACGGSPSAELLRQAFDVVESRPDSTLVILGKYPRGHPRLEEGRDIGRNLGRRTATEQDIKERGNVLQVEQFNDALKPLLHTPSLSPSPVRGMFRFGNMVSGVSFILKDYSFVLHILFRDSCTDIYG